MKNISEGENVERAPREIQNENGEENEKVINLLQLQKMYKTK